MNKKILIAVGVLAVAIIAAVVVFVLVRRNQGTPQNAAQNTPQNTTNLPEGQSPEQTGTTPGENTGTPSTATQFTPALSKIVNAKVIAPHLTTDGAGILFYNEATGQFFVVNPDGSNQHAIAESVFTNVVGIDVSPSARAAIISFKSDKSNQTIKYYFDIPTNTANRLNDHIDTFAFSPDGSKIFYRYNDTDTKIQTLNIANANGSDFKKIKDFPIDSVKLAWIPGKDQLSFWLQPFALRRSALYKMDLDGGNVVAVFNKGYGVDGIWSPDGSRILATFAAENAVTLHLEAVGIDGSEKVTLPSSKTVMQKCAWANDNVNVFCAIPKQIAPRTVLPDDYIDGKITTDDDIYRINTKTGERFLVGLIDTTATDKATVPTIDATNLFVSRDNGTLFFVNHADGDALYAVNLSRAGL